MRLAIVGTGQIAKLFTEAAKQFEEIQLLGVYTRSVETARTFANNNGLPLIFKTLEALASSNDIDAVYIASPNTYHCSQSIMMMEHGKHVLCEKPIAVHSNELKRMLEVSKNNGVILLEAFRHLYSPGTQMLRALLPEVGIIRRVSLVLNHYSSKYDKFKQGDIYNVFSSEYAGGALMDIGIYCIQLMIALFGEPRHIISDSILLHTGVDGQGAAIVRYDEFLVELSYSKISQSETPSVIQGENGSLLFQNLSVISDIHVKARGGKTETIVCENESNQLLYEVRAFMDAIATPSKADVYNQYSIKAMKIIDSITTQKLQR